VENAYRRSAAERQIALQHAAMLDIRFGQAGANLKVLCFGAHADDIEIGCGGTILRLLDEHDDLEVRWVVLSAVGIRAIEAEQSAQRFLAKARHRTVVIRDFGDGFFQYVGADIKLFFEQLKGAYSPDLIFTHCRGDLHQDHRLVSELTWSTFRDHLILEYEIVKYDGDLGAPSFFVPLSDAICRTKVSTLMECFGSQRAKTWFSEDTFFSILRLRGVECRAPEKYAEAYYCRKLVY
jgi:LmbE family N-acetylglucosaminyl deacetylase